jgi:iron(III) transport system permease protein
VARADRGQAGTVWRTQTQSIAGTVITVLAIATVAAPIGAVAFEAQGAQSTFAGAVSLEAARNTFVWSAAGASAVMVFGALLGYWRAKAAPRPARIAEALWVTLFAIPATVVGVGLIGVWNRPGILGDIYRTDAIVVLAYVARFLPIAALLCAAFLRRVPSGAEEAALIAGASSTRTFVRIFLPMSRRGLAAVWLVMFILMCGDLALTILVAPPGESNLAVWAYTLIANSPTSEVARLALVQMAIAILPLVAIAVLLRDRSEET